MSQGLRGISTEKAVGSMLAYGYIEVWSVKSGLICRGNKRPMAQQKITKTKIVLFRTHVLCLMSFEEYAGSKTYHTIDTVE